MAGMAGEIDGDVDLICAKLRPQRGVVDTMRIPPDAADPLQSGGDEVGVRDLGIAIDLDRCWIVMREQRLEEEAHRVIAEIGREIGDA